MRPVIVLPTYNERDNIQPFLEAVRAVPCELDVLVVDDNSPDGTADLALAVGERLGGVDVLRRAAKNGLGSAYRAGFEHVLDAGYDVIVSMDADLSHDPAVLPSMLRLLEGGADAVVGSRYVTGGGTTDWPIRRQLLSKWGNAYTRTLLRLEVRDCTSGFRAYRAEALRGISPSTTGAEGYAFLTELVRRLTRKGYRIEETPIVFRDRTHGTSKMSGRIIVESMLLVTRWGLADRLRRRR
ncbi:MAG: polyprenol monophosphomannose synthase [Ilumatobacter sp.]|uniref:polyprenol monophosphomannose synthase n=1 Tax=Ilumatobacter sp. TaxID=1967498 RepID=UPI00261D4854|nr:polyprenol monophosphomannose synthase [Ilumatobacter sp.]MDJ0767316.1 polyprenol monophosphomannose synthase [Ilumatobacter sp.]